MLSTKPEPVVACAQAPCAEALEHPVRLGRARYACPVCGRDVSLAVCLLAQAMDESDDA